MMRARRQVPGLSVALMAKKFPDSVQDKCGPPAAALSEMTKSPLHDSGELFE